jgi:hypothetical protein
MKKHKQSTIVIKTFLKSQGKMSFLKSQGKMSKVEIGK